MVEPITIFFGHMDVYGVTCNMSGNYFKCHAHEVQGWETLLVTSQLHLLSVQVISYGELWGTSPGRPRDWDVAETSRSHQKDGVPRPRMSQGRRRR